MPCHVNNPYEIIMMKIFPFILVAHVSQSQQSSSKMCHTASTFYLVPLRARLKTVELTQASLIRLFFVFWKLHSKSTLLKKSEGARAPYVSMTPLALVILDPKTANPHLVLSDDLTSVRFSQNKHLQIHVYLYRALYNTDLFKAALHK